MTFYQLYDKLNECYPNALKCEWDNDGIMCADFLDREVKRVLIALDVTMDTIEFACKNGYNTIISHHPLVFRSQKSLTPLAYTQKKLISLIKNEISVMSFHTRLDASMGGVNDTLANLLGLEEIVTDSTDPIGRIGYTKNEMELEAFAKNVKMSLLSPVVLYSGSKMVKKVYVVGGDGKDLIENAIANGCDTIVTGRGSYNTSVDATDMGLNIVEAGHFYTENPVCSAIETKIKEIDASIETYIFNSNKINFA